MNDIVLPPLPEPTLDAINTPFWEAVRQGRLTFQRCPHCEHAWLPPRSECPNCLKADPVWEEASGKARLISWVVYYMPFNPAFKDRCPYNVAVVELEEGARMISNIVGVADQENMVIDMSLKLKFEKDGEALVPRFEPA